MRDCCGSWLVRAYRDAPGKSRAVPLRCFDRLCAACAHAKAARFRDVLGILGAQARHAGRVLKFVTLTQRARAGESLRDAQARLRGNVRKLFRRKAWRAWLGAGGGIGRVETTWNAEGSWWHVHAHLVADLAYVPSAELRELWESVTGDSFEADIRAAREDVADELLKYLVKAATLPADRLVEYARTMHRRREVFTFGSLYGKGALAVEIRELLDAEEHGEDATLGPSVVLSIPQVEALAREGDPAERTWARIVLSAVDAQIAELRVRADAKAARRTSRAGPKRWHPAGVQP